MGIDTTPGSNDGSEQGRDEAPRWFLVLVVVIVALGALWVLWTFFSVSRPA
jgi:heme/copper-type cytochrome/quinol oxidase subunit 4